MSRFLLDRLLWGRFSFFLGRCKPPPVSQRPRCCRTTLHLVTTLRRPGTRQATPQIHGGPIACDCAVCTNCQHGDRARPRNPRSPGFCWIFRPRGRGVAWPSETSLYLGTKYSGILGPTLFVRLRLIFALLLRNRFLGMR